MTSASGHRGIPSAPPASIKSLALDPRAVKSVIICRDAWTDRDTLRFSICRPGRPSPSGPAGTGRDPDLQRWNLLAGELSGGKRPYCARQEYCGCGNRSQELYRVFAGAELRSRPLLLLCRTRRGKEKIMTLEERRRNGSNYIPCCN